MNKPFFLIILFFLLSLNLSGQVSQELKNENLPLPLPKVDQRIELLSIVFRLAGNSEYNMDRFKDYVKDIHDHFDKYKEHPVIKFAIALREKNGVSYDAVMAMAVHLKQPPVLSPVIPFTASVPESRWGIDNANKFVALLKQFYKEAKCEEFFKQHQELYKLAQERFKTTVFDSFDNSWYKLYYGKQPDGSMNIIIGLGNGGQNYGSKIVYPDGRENAYAIMGTWSVDNEGKPSYTASGYMPTLVHEFNHSFVNHLIDKNEKELEASGKLLFEPVKSIMQGQAYSNWKTMMQEALVRASVVRYLMKHNSDENDAKGEMKTQISNGFLWMKSLVDTLGYYETNRTKYPTLESFMPCLIGFYKETADKYNTFLDNCVHVKAIEPFNNNAVDVLPELTEMKVIFDKPLTGKGYSIWLGKNGKEFFPIVDKGIKYADNNTAIILNIKLKSNTEYEFLMVGRAFKTPDGFPLIDYKVTFKTK